MKNLAMHSGMKQIALVGLLAVVTVAMSGCATMANSSGGSARPSDSRLAGHHEANANTLYGMSRLLRSQGKHQQAEFVLLSLERDHPAFSPTYNDLAEIRMSQNRLDEAIEYLEKGIAVAPNDAVLLNNAGVFSVLKRDFDSALIYFRRASAIAPYKARYRANVALAMGLTGEVEGSRSMYGQIVSAEEADFNAALIHRLAGPEPVEQAAVVLPFEASYQEAELEATETAHAVRAEEPETTTFVQPVAAAPEPVVEPAAPEAVADAHHTEAAEPVVEPSIPVASFTNSDVADLESEIASEDASSEVIDTTETGTPTDAVGFEIEAVETESTDIKISIEPSQVGEAAAELSVETPAAEAKTTADAKAYFAAPVETRVAFAIEEGEPSVGDSSAFVFEAVEPQEDFVAPESTVQERQWVDGEYLLRETTLEEHRVVNAPEFTGVQNSMLEEFVATETRTIEDSAAAEEITVSDVAEATTLEQ